MDNMKLKFKMWLTRFEGLLRGTAHPANPYVKLASNGRHVSFG